MTEVSYQVVVSTANVWTELNSPRTIDRLILENPANIRRWINSMSFEEKLNLCDANLIQSQLLYGEEVVVIDGRNNWVKVAIPHQPSSKTVQGYPGWVPKAQLKPISTKKNNRDKNITIIAPTAYLYDEDGIPFLEVSYLTSLPYIDESEQWYVVNTPNGPKKVKKQDTIVGYLQFSKENMIKETNKFLGLDYLWGGMTGFGFDCSGFSHSILRAFGKIIPRDASDQVREGLAVNKEDVAPGDLLFFAYEKGEGRVHHVGIYYKNGQMIHAPKTGKQIEIVSIANTIYEEELCAIKRFIE